jgi:hypothetical protein
MSATVLPADDMIAVLSDAIASKRDTIALLERTAKDAQADLQHLRQERAVRLARVAGFEVGQVWLLSTHNRIAQPGILFGVLPAWNAADAEDWKMEFLFERNDRYADSLATVASREAGYSCVGRIDSGPIVEKFAAMALAMREQKEKAAA